MYTLYRQRMAACLCRPTNEAATYITCLRPTAIARELKHRILTATI